jgi:hypothetical protein
MLSFLVVAVQHRVAVEDALLVNLVLGALQRGAQRPEAAGLRPRVTDAFNRDRHCSDDGRPG